jgi:hypothetical protein
LILQNFFRKLSFFETNFVKKFYYTKKIMQCYTKFLLLWPINLGSTVVVTGWGGGEELEVHMNLMPPGVTKVGFFSLFWTFRAASH